MPIIWLFMTSLSQPLSKTLYPLYGSVFSPLRHSTQAQIALIAWKPSLVVSYWGYTYTEKEKERDNSAETEKETKKEREKRRSSPGGLEPPTFRLTAERANRLRHGDLHRQHQPNINDDGKRRYDEVMMACDIRNQNFGYPCLSNSRQQEIILTTAQCFPEQFKEKNRGMLSTASNSESSVDHHSARLPRMKNNSAERQVPGRKTRLLSWNRAVGRTEKPQQMQSLSPREEKKVVNTATVVADAMWNAHFGD